MKTVLRYYGSQCQSSEPEYLVFSLLLSACNKNPNKWWIFRKIVIGQQSRCFPYFLSIIHRVIWPLFSISKAQKMSSFFFLNEIKSQSKFGLEVTFQWKLLHWGTVRYLMNWIPGCLIQTERDLTSIFHWYRKKPSSVFTSLPPKHESMKANLSQKAMKLGPNDNCFTEELVGIILTEFRLFISFWKRFDLYFPFLKPKKRALFFFFYFWMKSNLSQNLALKLASNENYFTEELLGILWIEFKLFISNWKRFDPYYFPLLKTKKRAHFLLPFLQSKWKYESMKPNLSQKAMKLAPNDKYLTEEHHIYTYTLYSKQ